MSLVCQCCDYVQDLHQNKADITALDDKAEDVQSCKESRSLGRARSRTMDLPPVVPQVTYFSGVK